MKDLKEKARFVQWNDGNRKECYAIFAKSFKRRITGPNLFLFGLKGLERALSRPAAQ